jgi:hypothetical protein
MRTEAQQNWIDNLLSGAYPQTTGCLADDKGFCCLGVAASITEGIPFRINADGEGLIATPGTWESDTTIPEEYEDILGLNIRLKNYLMAMNDGDQYFTSKGKHSRVEGNKRDFAFIARFLEIVWPIEKD